MERDWQAFQVSTRKYFQKELKTVLTSEVVVRLDDGRVYRFDLGSEDGAVLVGCKSVTFTSTGNEPSAKLNHATTDANLLRASHASRKIIVFDDDIHPKKGSLAELFARRSNTWLADVEVWRSWNGKFEKNRTALGRANRLRAPIIRSVVPSEQSVGSIHRRFARLSIAGC